MLIKNINHRIIIPLSFFFLLFLLFNYFISFSQSQICLPLNGYLVWPGSWEEGWVPMASSSQYFLTRSPIKVYNGNVGIDTLPLAYKLQVNGDISGTRLCIGSDCRNSWPSVGGNISGSGNQGQVTFWTSSTTISGSNNLFWDNNNNRLGIGTTTPQSTLHVIGNIIANNFLGKINASYVSSGQFGSLTGGGNYSFPANLGINVTTTDILGKLHIRNTTTTIKDLYIESNNVASFIKIIGGTNSDEAYSIQQTSDGGYI